MATYSFVTGDQRQEAVLACRRVAGELKASVRWPDGAVQHNVLVKLPITRGEYTLSEDVYLAPIGEGTHVRCLPGSVIDKVWTIPQERYTPEEQPMPADALLEATNIERDRRRYPGSLTLGLGWAVDLRNETDEKNISGKVLAAVTGEEPIIFMGADNTPHELTAAQMIDVGKAVDAWVSHIYTKSWVIKQAIQAETITLLSQVHDDANWS